MREGGVFVQGKEQKMPNKPEVIALEEHSQIPALGDLYGPVDANTALLLCVREMGIERIMFSVDDPVTPKTKLKSPAPMPAVF